MVAVRGELVRIDGHDVRITSPGLSWINAYGVGIGALKPNCIADLPLAVRIACHTTRCGRSGLPLSSRPRAYS